MAGMMKYKKGKKGGKSAGKLRKLSKASGGKTGGVKTLFGARVIGGK
jgi:hypothetical protein